MNPPESSFSLLFDEAGEGAAIVAECPMCGAMTMLPIEVAWRLGVVHCSECGTTMTVTRATLEHLKAQAQSAFTTVERLLGPST
jgi:hypothetical protein